MITPWERGSGLSIVHPGYSLAVDIFGGILYWHGSGCGCRASFICGPFIAVSRDSRRDRRSRLQHADGPLRRVLDQMARFFYDYSIKRLLRFTA